MIAEIQVAPRPADPTAVPYPHVHIRCSPADYPGHPDLASTTFDWYPSHKCSCDLHTHVVRQVLFYFDGQSLHFPPCGASHGLVPTCSCIVD